MSVQTRRSIVALIPARSGSKRVPNKNIRQLGEHPLLAYSIAAATDSELFDAVVVSTETENYAEIARHYGAEVPFLMPKELATDKSPDIHWVSFTLKKLAERGDVFDVFSILRPTSPFRTAGTIRRALSEFDRHGDSADSLRAVEPCGQHPAKMWTIENHRLIPIMRGQVHGVPWHSSPKQALPPVWVQNASLEIAWTRCVLEDGTIAGRELLPFFTTDQEGLDVNTERDWEFAEALLRRGLAELPRVTVEPFQRRG